MPSDTPTELVVTADHLRQLAPKIRNDRALIYADALNAALIDGELNSALRLRHYMAQIAHETGGFGAPVESMAYKEAARLDKLFANVQGVEHAERLIKAGPQAIANTICAHKLGNGGVDSGDGFRFRGRGFTMVTGRANYRTCAAMTGLPLEEQPDLLGEPGPAARAAAKFWISRRINLAADADDLNAVTTLVNGHARLGLEDRKNYLTKAATIWMA